MIESLAAARPAISALCHRFGVLRLDVFGSAARGVDFTDESGIDLLVEFEGDGAPSIGNFFDLRDALADLLGRRVDLVMGRAIRNPYLRAEIDASREPLHAA